VFALASAAAEAQSLNERVNQQELAFMSSEEPAMRQAFERAKATLDEFLRKVEAPPPGTTGFALKVAVSDGKNIEYFWVNRFAVDGEAFTGHLGNEPRMVKKYKLGERFSFHRSQVVDWTYQESSVRRMHGNFTACALLTKESAADAEAFKKRFGLKCE